MTGDDIPCDLPSRISRLTPADQALVERFVRVLETRRRPAFETPNEFLRRRVEAARSRTD